MTLGTPAVVRRNLHGPTLSECCFDLWICVQAESFECTQNQRNLNIFS